MTTGSVRGFEVNDGQLAVGGVGLTRLAARVGSTPFFCYDRQRVRDRVAEVRRAIGDGVELKYAVKANPMAALVGLLAGLVDGLDVASGGELKIALDAGMAPARVAFAGPGKSDTELSQAVAAGCLIEVESPGEARRIEAVGARLGLRPRVALRINPDFAVKGSGMRMGGGPQQFGVDAEQAPEVLALIGSLGLDFEGFHVFAGSQNLLAEVIGAAQRSTVDLVLRLADAAPGAIRYLNLGGGLGIPYSDRDRPLELSSVGETLRELATRLAAELPGAQPVIELGRYLVGEAGLYVTRVVDVKESRGTTFAVVDGGMHHQLAASGNLGQVIRRNYPLVLGNKATVSPTGSVSVVGCLCTPLDLLGDKVPLPDVEVGDLVVIFQAGAYGLTASPTGFLGHPAPVEVLV